MLYGSAAPLCGNSLFADDRVYSVCSLLHKLKRFHNQMVRIRGTVQSGLETFCLRDSCDFRLKTVANTWPSAIWLAGPAMAESAIDFQSDMKSIQRLHDLLHEKTRDFSAEVVATIEGKLEAHPLRTGIGGNGQAIGMGYGHLGGFPAQLIIKSASSMSE
jgi:hypothetical protein